MKYSQMHIYDHKVLTPGVMEMVLSYETLDEPILPGQFITLNISNEHEEEVYLQRPISICDHDEHHKRLKIVYKTLGKGTIRMSHKKKGESIMVLGPLGNGFPISSCKTDDKVLLLGGGVGIPPMVFLAKALCEKGVDVQVVLGFQSEKEVFLEKAFPTKAKVIIAIDQLEKNCGSFFSGNAVNVAKDQVHDFNLHFSCGPKPMLKAIEQAFSNKEGYVSMEEHMACGIGACYGCVCKDTTGKNKKVCSDGPVFKIGEVVI